MNLRLKTQIEDEEKILELQSGLQVNSRAAIMRLAIAFSLRIDTDPRITTDGIFKYNTINQNGNDYNRFTIFGSDEILYKSMMQQRLGKHIDDDSFFPELTYCHISRGLKELYADFKLAGNKEKFLKKILI